MISSLLLFSADTISWLRNWQIAKLDSVTVNWWDIVDMPSLTNVTCCDLLDMFCWMFGNNPVFTNVFWQKLHFTSYSHSLEDNTFYRVLFTNLDSRWHFLPAGIQSKLHLTNCQHLSVDCFQRSHRSRLFTRCWNWERERRETIASVFFSAKTPLTDCS